MLVSLLVDGVSPVSISALALARGLANLSGKNGPPWRFFTFLEIKRVSQDEKKTSSSVGIL